jgi:hypothetical protein
LTRTNVIEIKNIGEYLFSIYMGKYSLQEWTEKLTILLERRTFFNIVIIIVVLIAWVVKWVCTQLKMCVFKEFVFRKNFLLHGYGLM